METVDYLICNGRVIDCYNHTDAIQDIAVKDGVIVPAQQAEAAQVVDASGCVVIPGLIDFHCHVASRITALGIEAESSYFPMGVTTAVDAGSTGVDNYLAFRNASLSQRLRIKAFLNLCAAGLVTTAYHEDIAPEHMKKKQMLLFLKRYSDQILGLKVRQSAEIAEGRGLDPLRALLEVAEEASVPVVVHTTNPPEPAEHIAELLRPGDVYAHVYQGKGWTVIREQHVIPEFFAHQKRGVIFDAANGMNHFSLDVAQTCLAEGFLPDVISTDLTVKTVFKPGKVFSLPFIMSKYLALGMSLKEIVQRTTTTPARLLGAEKELGSLSAGTCADIAILRPIAHSTTFTDFAGQSIQGSQLLKTELTMRAGEVVFRQIDF